MNISPISDFVLVWINALHSVVPGAFQSCRLELFNMVALPLCLGFEGFHLSLSCPLSCGFSLNPLLCHSRANCLSYLCLSLLFYMSESCCPSLPWKEKTERQCVLFWAASCLSLRVTPEVRICVCVRPCFCRLRQNG